MKTDKNKYFVTFAGPVGSSKTPIAFHLSQTFGLAMYNTDAIRTEVEEDLLVYNEEEFSRRRDERLKRLVSLGRPFILDASVDRVFDEYEREIVESGYRYFLISLDLSKEFLINLYRAKRYHESIKRVDQLLLDHEKFLDKFGKNVNVHIKDKDFPARLEICAKEFSRWLNEE